jgi:hypothetical protein
MNAPLEAIGQLALFLGMFLCGRWIPELTETTRSLKSLFFWIAIGTALSIFVFNLPFIHVKPQIQAVSILLFWIGVGFRRNRRQN